MVGPQSPSGFNTLYSRRTSTDEVDLEESWKQWVTLLGLLGPGHVTKIIRDS